MIELIKQAGPRALTLDVPEEVRRELARDNGFRREAGDLARPRYAAMHERQAAIAKANDAVEHKAVDGIGVKVGSIDAEIWLQMMALYGSHCWDDPDFVTAFFRDNPACRVKTTRGTRGQEYGGHG